MGGKSCKKEAFGRKPLNWEEISCNRGWIYRAGGGDIILIGCITFIHMLLLVSK